MTLIEQITSWFWPAPTAAPPSQLVTGAVVCGAQVAQLPGAVCTSVSVKAVIRNKGNIFVGGRHVSVWTDIGSDRTGYWLAPGEDVTVTVTNVNQVYVIGTSKQDAITFIANGLLV